MEEEFHPPSEGGNPPLEVVEVKVHKDLKVRKAEFILLQQQVVILMKTSLMVILMETRQKAMSM